MTNGPVNEFFFDRLRVRVCEDRRALGEAAAQEAEAALAAATAQAARVAVVFAAAPSQSETLRALTAATTIAWPRVLGLHMDEYAGLSAEHPASFRRYLREHLIAHVTMGDFDWIKGEAADLAAVCRDYARRLAQRRPALCLLGIGENGHLAFNDPGEARFDDPNDVRIVTLDRACREQQVAEGHFPSIEAVPEQAVTLTVPALVRIPHLIASVPGERKAEAVRKCLLEPVSEDCPASILRTHPHATLYLDQESARLLSE